LEGEAGTLGEALTNGAGGPGSGAADILAIGAGELNASAGAVASVASAIEGDTG
jgi:hypothetical protein